MYQLSVCPVHSVTIEFNDIHNTHTLQLLHVSSKYIVCTKQNVSTCESGHISDLTYTVISLNKCFTWSSTR